MRRIHAVGKRCQIVIGVRHRDPFGKAASLGKARQSLIGADCLMPRRAIGAPAAGKDKRRDHLVTHLPPVHPRPCGDYLTAVFMPRNMRQRHGIGSIPRVPVRPADAARQNLQDNAILGANGIRNLLDFQRGVEFGQYGGAHRGSFGGIVRGRLPTTSRMASPCAPKQSRNRPARQQRSRPQPFEER